jgi:hypothetical protein
MNKENLIKTQEMWKDYPKAKQWIDTICNPSKHIIINNNEIISYDSEYVLAVESLSYILLGKEMTPKNKKVIDK